MGLSSSKSKNTPWAPAQPYIIKGMEQTSATYDENQPRLQDMSKQAYDAFNSISPEAFQSSPFVQSAQASAQALGSGAGVGINPGASTYARMQAPNASAADPSTGLLSSVANGTSGSNPATSLATGVAGGKYLNAQPSASMYQSMMDPSYSTANPFLDAIVKQSQESVTKAANQRFGAAGMGAGLSTAFGDVLSKNLADSENNLRYQNYNDAENRRLQAAGQSDAAWSGERGRMDASTGLLSSDFNADQGRKLAAAQALGGQYSQGQDRALDAAKAADSSQAGQVQQMLTALGLTGDLRNAEFAGVSPALALLNSAADIPYVGTAALNGQIRQASNGYGTTTTSGNIGQQLLGAGAQAGSAAIMASDRRLKTNISKVGEFDDGLGIYDYEYVDLAFGEGRQRGVMADEVERLRPWALGPKINGEFATVDYGAL